MAKESELMQAIQQICEEKNISYESIVETIEAALAVAYRKDFGEKNQNIKVTFDPKTAKALVFDVKTVVPDEKAEKTEALKAELQKKKDEGEEVELTEEQKEEWFNPKTEITLSEAKKIKKGMKVGEEIRTELFPPTAYGRMAAQTAKQVIIQRIREAERNTIFKEYKGREKEILNGTVQRVEGRMVFVDLGHATALLPPSEQIHHERYAPGQRLKVFLVSVNETPKGPEVIVSRSHPEMVQKIFSMEVPEIAAGTVEIKSVAREAGSRSKIAVSTNQKGIDPVGSCVGQRGSRVQTIISELGGEKIDIIKWEEDPIQFIISALSPAKVLKVQLNEQEKIALAEVREDQLSLAIGKGGQNVRLATKLTGWKIDLVGEGKKKEEAETKHQESANKEEAPMEQKVKPDEEQQKVELKKKE